MALTRMLAAGLLAAAVGCAGAEPPPDPDPPEPTKKAAPANPAPLKNKTKYGAS